MIEDRVIGTITPDRHPFAFVGPTGTLPNPFVFMEAIGTPRRSF